MYYKVVIVGDDGVFESSVAYGRWKLRYVIGQLTKPKAGGIFVFDTLSNAKQYVEWLDKPNYVKTARILEVEAFDCWIPSYVCTTYEEDILDMFHGGIDPLEQSGNFFVIADKPQWGGTILAKTVMPLRVVTEE